MKQAPDFTLPDQNGTEHSLKDYRGHWVVLYFYPRDNTPGCTVEACSFRDARDAIAEYGNAVVIGISKDSVKSHENFTKKFNLNFTLLSDPSTETIQAYDSWKEKSMYGRKYMGIMRNTFIINPDGEIVREFIKVSPLKHVREILDALAELQKA